MFLDSCCMQWEETRARKQTILLHSIVLYCMYPDEWEGSEREEGECPRLATCRFFRGGRRPDLARGSCRVCTWTAFRPSMSTSMSLPASPGGQPWQPYGSRRGVVLCRLVRPHGQPRMPRPPGRRRSPYGAETSTTGYAGVLFLSRRDSRRLVWSVSPLVPAP